MSNEKKLERKSNLSTKFFDLERSSSAGMSELNENSPRHQTGNSPRNLGDRQMSQRFSELSQNKSRIQRFGSSEKEPQNSPSRMSQRYGSSEKEIVRVVSQRALTSQVAKNYLETIEKSTTPNVKKPEDEEEDGSSQKQEEEEEDLEQKRKVARRLLGSFSMYQEIDNHSAFLSPSMVEILPSESVEQLDYEYENAILNLLRNRKIATCFLTWRTFVEHRKKVAKAALLPSVALKKSKAKRPPPVFNPRKSRLSIVRSPIDRGSFVQLSGENITDESPVISETDPFSFEEHSDSHKHRLNLGRKSVFNKSRKSVLNKNDNVIKDSPSSKQEDSRSTTPIVEENQKAQINTLVENNSNLKTIDVALLCKKQETNVKSLSIIRKDGDTKYPSLQRRLSWSEKGKHMMKTVFAPSKILLKRIPSKEQMFSWKTPREIV